jgi:hypothetical protein
LPTQTPAPVDKSVRVSAPEAMAPSPNAIYRLAPLQLARRRKSSSGSNVSPHTPTVGAAAAPASVEAEPTPSASSRGERRSASEPSETAAQR